MRKKSIFLACVLLISLLAPLFAQDSETKKRNTYTKVFPVERVYGCIYGFMVAYRNSTYDLKELYVARKHFSGAAGKAMLAKGRGPEYPYLSVTWKDGVLDHITIYAVDSGDGIRVLRGTDDELKALFPEDIDIKF